MFTFIAYKPDGSEYIRGCHMQSYDSDITIGIGLNRKELINEWVNINVYNELYLDNQEPESWLTTPH